MRESTYQAKLIKKLNAMFPGCVVLKNDAGYIQGVPDLTILYGPRWAVLEVKAHEYADLQPNQEWYINQLGGMSFAAFIYPQNEEEVLSELQQAFQPRRKTRVS